MPDPKELVDYWNTIIDALDKSPDIEQGDFEGFGEPEVGLGLDQFSNHRIRLGDLGNDQINTFLGIDYCQKAFELIDKFGMNGRAKTMEYPEILDEGEFGYDPDRIRQFEKDHSISTDGEALEEYGSGGTPEMLRRYKVFNYKMNYRDFVTNNVMRPSGKLDPLFLDALTKKLKRFEDLAWCATARSIELCHHVSAYLGKDWGDWLLKIAVHAACTLERVKAGVMEVPMATLAMLKLPREIGSIIHRMIFFPASAPVTPKVLMKIVAISAMLMDAGHNLIRAATYLTLTKPNPKAILLCLGRAGLSAEFLRVPAKLFAKLPTWKELIKSRIKKTNFCPARLLHVNLELHSRAMFHLISRSEYITTSRKLHSDCNDTCIQEKAAQKIEDASGHTEDGCQCATTYFTPIETIEIVLLDIKDRKLVPIESGMQYVAVSQIWFQGVFGQASRKCGDCTLQLVETVCHQLGVRYAWIDTICMPSLKELRPLAVGRLREIYLKAGAALVIDTGLIATKAKNVLDLSLAIWLSDWASRVWTLQEGVLSSKLLFCVGNDVLALPQIGVPDILKNAQLRVSSTVLANYGKGKLGLDTPLDRVLNIAAGRTTSWPQDYLYGLAALLPPSKLPRHEDPNLMAVEVARLYQKVDLGLLETNLERCGIEGYRWMPKGARSMRKQFETGLQCTVTALIELDSVVERLNPDTHEPRGGAEVALEIKYWYSTRLLGMRVGTCVEAKDLIFCQVGHVNNEESGGFVVTPTAQSGVYQYIGGAAMKGKVPENPVSILVS
ncbi:MAG: hypothetical protein J3R72DRAFT_474040 [Linnemannia gamsii]|nr:MAG: hypothetical protein J3R72DRAFT_474040 [Linnemannia gamsii]